MANNGAIMRSKVFLTQFFYLTAATFSFGQESLNALTGNFPSQNTGRKLDSIFASFNNNQSPGVAVSLIQNGNVGANKAYGMASIELRVPFSHQSIVRIGYSEAREFISIAAILMENDGVFTLNDKVRKYFPNLPEWSEPVTIWDLLNHRSGFADEWATALLMHGAMSNRFDKDQFFRLLYTQPEPEIEPGKGFMYSNSDFGLLRLIMEKASGKDLGAWIKQRVFDPLKMNNTIMQGNARDIIPNRATKYQYDGLGFQHANVQKTSPGGNYFILTCADDLEKWSLAISNPGTELNKALDKLLNNVRMIPGKKNHHVTGHSIDTVNGHRIIIHEGVNGENYLTRIPSKGIAIITLGNLDGQGFSEQNKSVRDYVLNVTQPLFTKPGLATNPVAIAEAALIKYEGNYLWLDQVSWESYNKLRKLSRFFVEDAKLKLRYNGNYTIELIPVGKDLFYYQEDFGMQVKFIQPQGSTSMKVTVAFDDGYPGVTMERETGNWLPSRNELKSFTGKYHSRHLDYYWNFELNDQGKLVLKRPTMPDTIIEPDGENQFHYIAEKNPGDGFDQWILFDKSSTGKITGLTVRSARVMHHRFSKQ
jgi:CubicO group peptidase (beta-lactamase class C family)